MTKKGILQGEFKDSLDDLDKPVPSGLFDIFSKGKLQCRIVYEDGSYKDFFKNFSTSYVIEINKRDYLVVPRCIIRGKNNSITWFFNNPIPINYEYQQSSLNAFELLQKDKKKGLSNDQKSILIRTTLDSEGLHSIFNTKLLQGLYPQEGMSGKQLMIWAIGGVLIVLVILQVTGTVDVVGEFKGLLGG